MMLLYFKVWAADSLQATRLFNQVKPELLEVDTGTQTQHYFK